MKTVEFELAGETYHLCLNGAALFDCYDKLGDDPLDKIKGNSPEAFESTCWMLAKLSEQGELCRRFQGMDKGRILSFQHAKAMLAPLDVLRARESIRAAWNIGFDMTEDEDEEIDLGLMELQKKTAPGTAVRGICRFLASFFTSH